RGPGRGLPGRRCGGGAQTGTALRDLAGHGGRDDGRAAGIDQVLGDLPGRERCLGGRRGARLGGAGVSVEAFEFATAGRGLVGAGRSADLPGLLAGDRTPGVGCPRAGPGPAAGLRGRPGRPAAACPVAGEPTVDLARTAVAAARAHGADVVAAIGGGSVIDTGKAVAMLLGNGGDPLDYLEVIGQGRAITRPSMPCIAVPTTAGTGAEVTANAVLADPAHRVKASLRGLTMIPWAALVDPLLTVSCPPAVTAASG